MSLNPLSSGIDWVAHRMKSMHEPIKVGGTVPDVKLSRLAPDGKTVEHFSTKKELSEGFAALFFMQKAFTAVSSDEHLPSLNKTAEVFKNQNIKMFCLAINTRDEMFAWGKQYHADPWIKMIPDFLGDFTYFTGLGVNKSGWRQLGFVAKPAAIFLYNGKVLDVRIEEDFGKCSDKSSAEGLLARIPSILKANNLTLELGDFELIETNDSDTAYLLQLLKKADETLKNIIS
ncbi:MAG TPA: redoxin family protein [Rhabdochlamydiaceae bacterium]|nr:redoxin family protein [Rhabdochlamydiaceae bacterium]